MASTSRHFGMSGHPSEPKRARREVVLNDDVTVVLDSENVPNHFKCPICLDIFQGDVYVCLTGGHSVCKKCQMETGSLICAVCRGPMKPPGGNWLRNRSLEETLDSYLIMCPFRKNGCLETLSRAELQNHKDSCVHDGNCVQICKFLNPKARQCSYWTRTTKPDHAIRHLEHHFSCTTTGRSLSVPIIDKGSPQKAKVVGIVSRQRGGIFLTTAWPTQVLGLGIDQISFACVRLDKPASDQDVKKTVELTIKSTTPGIPNFKVSMPTESVLNAKDVWKNQPVGIAKSRLKKYYLEPEENASGSSGTASPRIVKVLVKIL